MDGLQRKIPFKCMIWRHPNFRNPPYPYDCSVWEQAAKMHGANDLEIQVFEYVVEQTHTHKPQLLFPWIGLKQFKMLIEFPVGQ